MPQCLGRIEFVSGGNGVGRREWGRGREGRAGWWRRGIHEERKERGFPPTCTHLPFLLSSFPPSLPPSFPPSFPPSYSLSLSSLPLSSFPAPTQTRHFYNNALGISERQVSTMIWAEVVHRIVLVQHSKRLCVSR